MAKKKTNSDLMEALVKDIRKRKHTVVHDAPEVIDAISSGSLMVDHYLPGGFPRGAITEIYGPNNTGKTTMSLLMLREAMWEAHERDMYCFFVNAENRPLDGAWYAKLGLPYSKVTDETTGEISYQCDLQDDKGLPRLIIVESVTAEDTANTIMDMVESGLFVAGVLDSVANLMPKAEGEADFDKATQIGLQSRLMARWMRVMTNAIRRTGICLIFLNHYRVKIGASKYEPQGTSSGGNHFHHEATIRLETFRQKDNWEKSDDKYHVDMQIRFYVVKTSVSDNTGKLIEMTLIRDESTGSYVIDRAHEAFELCKQAGLFSSSDGSQYGSAGWCCFPATEYGYTDTMVYEENDVGHYKLGKSFDDVKASLRHDPDMLKACVNALRRYKQGTHITFS